MIRRHRVLSAVREGDRVDAVCSCGSAYHDLAAGLLVWACSH